MTEGWLIRIVEEFWTRAGGPEPFPRDLEQPILWALPLAILKLPRLSVSDVEAWLQQRGIAFQLDGANRPLRGCLVAYGGRGCVLLDGADHEDERRFSLAHETAHFLLDYLQPREQAVAQLGAGILEVFDGLRGPTVDERVGAVLGHASIGVHTHLMERQPDGVLGCGRIVGAESRADRLALELLAPAAEVQRRVTRFQQPSSFRGGVDLAVEVLASDFGLPAGVAWPYAKLIMRSWRGGPSFHEWLGIE
ncbi:MAG TPA: ImmA/IrrE family metallo-endopeptidase [Dehalococcoidia bacterium]|nr:ImmA/IrrE family metallo-endopeptidase [Dehalococcoidia bacterium]